MKKKMITAVLGIAVITAIVVVFQIDSPGVTIASYFSAKSANKDAGRQKQEEEEIETTEAAETAKELSAYEAVYYYEEKNDKRYEDYQLKHPEIKPEDIVWMVNENLDYPFYENMNTVQDVDVFPLIVNKYNQLPDDYEPDKLVSLSGKQYVTPETKIAFEEMRKAARKQGYTIKAASAYRSIKYQKQVYNGYLKKDKKEVVDTYSSRPGNSDHHTGRTIDLKGSKGRLEDFGKCKESGWIQENAYQYGFIVRYPDGFMNITGYKYEPWHITYVGKEVSTKMKETNIPTMEEFNEKYIKYKPEGDNWTYDKYLTAEKKAAQEKYQPVDKKKVEDEMPPVSEAPPPEYAAPPAENPPPGTDDTTNPGAGVPGTGTPGTGTPGTGTPGTGTPGTGSPDTGTPPNPGTGNPGGPTETPNPPGGETGAPEPTPPAPPVPPGTGNDIPPGAGAADPVNLL